MACSRRAFTLVELLVVIGIIALLISILMPALSAAKNQANRLKCSSNLRSLAQAVLQYANDNRGVIPRDYSTGVLRHPSWVDLVARQLRQKLPPAPANGQYSAAYDQSAAAYYANIAIFQCPSYPNERQPVDFVLNGWDIDTPSGGTGTLIKITRIRRSSELALLTEGHVNNATDSFDRHDVWTASHMPTGSEPRILADQRHRGLVNIAYADGHVVPKPYRDVQPRDFRVQP